MACSALLVSGVSVSRQEITNGGRPGSHVMPTSTVENQASLQVEGSKNC